MCQQNVCPTLENIPCQALQDQAQTHNSDVGLIEVSSKLSSDDAAANELLARANRHLVIHKWAQKNDRGPIL